MPRARKPIRPKTTAAGLSYGESPPHLRAYLVLRLAPGWELDETRGGFSAGAELLSFPKALPAGATVRSHVSVSAAKPGKARLPAERELARYVQVLLPRGTRMEAVRAAFAALRCVETIFESPPAGLP